MSTQLLTAPSIKDFVFVFSLPPLDPDEDDFFPSLCFLLLRLL